MNFLRSVFVLIAFSLLTSCLNIKYPIRAYVSKGKNKEGYGFTKVGEFSSFRQIEQETEFGHGTYVEKGDSILLYFGTAHKQFDLYYDFHRVQRGEETITVEAHNIYDIPIQGLQLTYGKFGKSNHIIRTNENGTATMSIGALKLNNQMVDLYLKDYRTTQNRLNFRRKAYTFMVVSDIGRTYKENVIEKYHVKYSGRKIILTGNGLTRTLIKTDRSSYLDLYHVRKKFNEY